jgi:hypothetical protein
LIVREHLWSLPKKFGQVIVREHLWDPSDQISSWTF